MNMRQMFMNFFVGMNGKSIAGLIVNRCAADNKVSKFQPGRFKIVKDC